MFVSYLDIPQTIQNLTILKQVVVDIAPTLRRNFSITKMPNISIKAIEPPVSRRMPLIHTADTLLLHHQLQDGSHHGLR